MVIDVVAAVIQNEEGKIFVAQRNLQKAQGGLWEFPGGKIEKDETREHAIEREIKEEFDMQIKYVSYLEEKQFVYPEKTINLIALKCEKVSGEPKLLEHESSKWIDIKEIDTVEFAPADSFIIERLKKDLL